MTYYLQNITAKTQLYLGGKSIPVGGTLEFNDLTAEILLALQRGDIACYDTGSGLPVTFEGWSVTTIETPLDPTVAAGLPPSARKPVVNYILVAPAEPGDPLEPYVPDATLRGELNLRLGIFRGAELAAYNRPFVLSSLGLSDVRGLENASAIEHLDLSDNNISVIGDLRKLKYLTYLDLSNNNLSAVPGLHLLTRLEEIRLSGNSLSTLGSLAKHVNLAHVDIRNNVFGQMNVDAIINDLWPSRHKLGQRNILIRLEGNTAPSPLVIDKIEGTGAYVNEGLKQFGCLVTYDAP